MEIGVESVTFLNGKDATEKYGENAKNGVVEITLKKENVKESNNMATENIEVIQADKIVTNGDNPTTLYLYKNALVRFKNMKVTADYIELNRDSSFILAKGTKDSTGTIVGKPLLTQGMQGFTATEIRYNFKSKKGIIYSTDKITQF